MGEHDPTSSNVRFEPNDRELEEVERFRRNTAEARRRGPPLGHQNGRKHGVYVTNFLNDEERRSFEAILARLQNDFEFNESSDLIQAELVAIYFLRLDRAQALGDFDAAAKIDGLIRAHFKDLKTTKLAREGDQPKKAEGTPADWATKVLEKARLNRKKGKAAQVTKNGGKVRGRTKGGGRKTEEELPISPEADCE